jgi:hypothetical protein
MTENGAATPRSPAPFDAQSSSKPSPAVPKLALSVDEACSALGISWDLWRSSVEPEVRVVRLGRRKLVAVAELERWLADRGEGVLERRS